MSASLFERLCFLDIETTGLDPAVDAVLEIGLVFVERGELTTRKQWLIKSPRPVAAFITALTGLSGDEGAFESYAQVEPELRAAITGWTMVAHNAAFERSFLRDALATHQVLDSWAVAMVLFPELEGHSLDALVRWLGVGRAARHRALEDAEDTFRMLQALCARLDATDVARARLSAEQLDLADPDQRALAEFLGRVVASPPQVAAPPIVSRPAWAEAVRTALSRHAPSAFEIEQGDLLPAAWALAEEHAPAAVAVAPRTFRRESTTRAALARRPMCLTGLRAAVLQHPRGFGRAWATSWVGVTKTADRDALGGALRARDPALTELFDAALRCTCDAPKCPARRAEPDGVVLISHALALDWMERGRAHRVFLVEAERLPEAERARAQLAVWFDVLEQRGIDCLPAREALMTFPAGVVPLRQRLDGGWVRVRAAMENVAVQLRAQPVSHERARLLQALVDVMAPPGPGFETVVIEDTAAEGPARRSGIVRAPIRPHAQIARRLRANHALFSGERGGLRWTKQGAWVIPAADFAGRVEWATEPISLERLPLVLGGLGQPITLITSEPLEAIADACAKAGLSASLDAERPANVHLRRWRRDQPTKAERPCVFYGVREWRRAILSTDAPRTVLLSPLGIDGDAFARACRGLKITPLQA